MQAEPAHRELVVAVVEAGYRAGATIVELQYSTRSSTRARLAARRDEALGAVSPWAKRRMRELVKPRGARAAITGESEPGYLDGVPPKRIARRLSRRAAKQTKFFRRANLDMSARWTGAGVADRLLGGPGVSRPLAARGQAQAGAGLPLVLPADGRGRQGLDGLAEARPRDRAARPRS